MACKDRAEDAGAIDVHDSHRVSWYFAFVYLRDPGGKGQDAITGYRKNQTGSCGDRGGSSLHKSEAVSITERQGCGRAITKIRPTTAMTVMKMLGPLPNAIA